MALLVIKAGSIISLLSGITSGLLLILSSLITLQGQIWALTLSAAIVAILVIVFAFRLVKTRKFIPARMITILGLIVVLLIFNQFLTS